jgi:hypothetical protein
MTRRPTKDTTTMASEKEIRRLQQLVKFTEAELAYVAEMLEHYRRHLAELLGEDSGEKSAVRR